MALFIKSTECENQRPDRERALRSLTPKGPPPLISRYPEGARAFPFYAKSCAAQLNAHTGEGAHRRGSAFAKRLPGSHVGDFNMVS